MEAVSDKSSLENIPASIRTLYRIIGKIIGKQIFDRITNDQNLHLDIEKRKVFAREVINAISGFRKELSSSRDFNKLYEIFNSLNSNRETIAIKQFAWILEAYLLLNQSSSASAEVTKAYVRTPDSLMMSKLIESLGSSASFFAQEASANLVLTAHPTAGIQPDYINHIKNMVSAMQKISEDFDPSKWDELSAESEVFESEIADIIDDLALSISHMVRAKPYNNKSLRPFDESRNFLSNIEEAWHVIPAKIYALERELKKTLGNDFRINKNFFKIHTWVARDIDGNPTVTKEEHLQSILQERVHCLLKYRADIESLYQSLSDDFTDRLDLPLKTVFASEDFKALYKKTLEECEDIENPHQAYRVVLYHQVLSKLNDAIDQALEISKLELPAFKKLKNFNLATDLLQPLELIRENKEAINTKEIDLIIHKANIFGDYGSHGHTRQGAEILEKMTRYLTGIWKGDLQSKTRYIFTENFQVTDTIMHKKLKKLFARTKAKHSVNYGMLRQKLDLMSKANDSEKIQTKIMQSFDLLEVSELGSIKRQIISMNESFEDMLNVLILTKTIEAFKPATEDELPYSRIEIVPLTEQITDLRNSYQLTIDALTNPAWLQYLIAHKGCFIKMRGPSDSGKQNGFVAAQWEMFRSKQLDTIVVEIFNAYLDFYVFENSQKLQSWKEAYADLKPSDEISENNVIAKSFIAFDKFFISEAFDKNLCLKAHKKLGLKHIKLVNFDGWGEPIERGGGLEFENTVKFTQPYGSFASYERTLQGGGAQQLSSSLRTRQAMQDFLGGLSAIATKRLEFQQNYNQESLMLDPSFVVLMQKFVLTLRSSLRGEIFGLDLENDSKVSDEACLRQYFSHVIKSPLIFLDLFNIASRPTSRSGAQLREYLDKDEFRNDLDKLAQDLALEHIVKILSDVRAIPYAAMFSLLGANHVSFYGYDKLTKSEIEQLSDFYHAENPSQESMLLRHIVGSLERGIITADQDCYKKAHQIIQSALKPDYDVEKDDLIKKFKQGEQATMNFVASIKKYKLNKPDQVMLEDLMQDSPSERDLLIARRNDAAVPRLGIAIAMSKILSYSKEKNLNPLDAENIPENYLDLLRKAFAAGASTFGNGCID